VVVNSQRTGHVTDTVNEPHLCAFESSVGPSLPVSNSKVSSGNLGLTFPICILDLPSFEGVAVHACITSLSIAAGRTDRPEVMVQESVFRAVRQVDLLQRPTCIVNMLCE
jgi:hypothetical protein